MGSEMCIRDRTHIMRTTTQILRTTAQILRTTTHIVRTTTHIVRTTTQIVRTTTQIVRTTTQILRTTTQFPDKEKKTNNATHIITRPYRYTKQPTDATSRRPPLTIVPVMSHATPPNKEI